MGAGGRARVSFEIDMKDNIKIILRQQDIS